MPVSYAIIKARKEADPEYAKRMKEYASKYREANRDKERERQRIVKAKLREKDRESYNAKMREYNKENVYPVRAKLVKELKEKRPDHTERVSTRSQMTKSEYWRHWKMKQTYGIGLPEYMKMYAEQCGKCRVCGDERPDFGKQGLVIDHCHTEGHIRGLLCVHCNMGLGQFKDDVQRMVKAIEYLKLLTKEHAMSRHSADLPLESLGTLRATKAIINATATATADQIATGLIECTSASAVSITMPTGTLLGARLGAQQGTVFELVVDNTRSTSSGVVTIVVSTNAILSESAVTTAASFGDLTVPVGVTGVGRYTLMFSSPTAYVITRTA